VSSVMVYARTATGNAAPLRTISGDATGINQAVGVAVETFRNEILVANGQGSIAVYDRTADGNVAPLRTVSGDTTGLSGPLCLAVDTQSHEMAVGNTNGSVNVYAETAEGDATPLRVINSAASLQRLSGIDVDANHDEVFLSNTRQGSTLVYSS